MLSQPSCYFTAVVILSLHYSPQHFHLQVHVMTVYLFSGYYGDVYFHISRVTV